MSEEKNVPSQSASSGQNDQNKENDELFNMPSFSIDSPDSSAGDSQSRPDDDDTIVLTKASEINTLKETMPATNNKNTTRLRRVKRKKKAGRSRSDEDLGFNWFFWISFVIIAIPVSVFLYLLLTASKGTGTPILGNRLDNDLKGYTESDSTYLITTEQISDVQSQIAAMSGVDSVKVNLTVETLRVTVDADDSYTNEQMQAKTEEIYNVITATLPVDKYFAQIGDYKQYDLDISVYNSLEAADFICCNLIKNSSMTTYTLSVETTPKNAELADNLHNPVDTSGDGTTEGPGASDTDDGTNDNIN